MFAYALRRWQPDNHILTTSRDEAWRKTLTQESDTASANLVVEIGKGQDQLGHRAIAGAWWTGTLDVQRQQTLIASPLRRELARRLASGQTAVWLFIPGGDAVADAAARTLLADRLAYLTKITELPHVEKDDPSASATMAMGGPPVRIEFSILDLRRDDAAEWVLAAQALAMRKEAKGPCALPVYGRARALDLLNGETFATGSIDDIVRFLTGACSCQMKEMNPGWDLLVACDWGEAISTATETAATTPPAAAKTAPETVVIAPAPATPAAPASRTDPTLPVMSITKIWVAGLVILALAGVAGVILRSRRNPPPPPASKS